MEEGEYNQRSYSQIIVEFHWGLGSYERGGGGDIFFFILLFLFFIFSIFATVAIKKAT